MQEILIHTISKIVPVPQEEIPLIFSYFKLKKYKRNEQLLVSGAVAHEIFFVLQGALHQYYIDEAGNERSCNFVFEEEFVTDFESFSQQTPATSDIKTLETTTCYVIRCRELVDLIKQSPAMAEYFRIVVEQLATDGIRRTKSFLSFSPEKRFLELTENKPKILQRIPQRLIAQYLGIAPESLSRIRKRLMGKIKS